MQSMAHNKPIKFPGNKVQRVMAIKTILPIGSLLIHSLLLGVSLSNTPFLFLFPTPFPPCNMANSKLHVPRR